MAGPYTGKRVLVTGATGFIGRALAHRLHSEGAHVLALARVPARGEDLAARGVEVVAGDITDQARMDAVLSQDVQIVMHIAAWLGGTDRHTGEAVNVAATRHLAASSAAAGVERFVFTSSIATYGDHRDRDVDEQTPVRPFGDPYADSKIRAEAALHEVAEQSGLPFCIVRPGMVYGPRAPGWTVRLAYWAREGKMPLIDGGRGSAYPIYIDNLVDLLLLCGIEPAAVGETFNAVDDGPVTLAEFLGAYMKMAGTQRAIRLPGWLAQMAAVLASPFVRRYKVTYVVGQMRGTGQISSRKAQERLGWSPQVSLDEGLRRSEEWLRSEGIL